MGVREAIKERIKRASEREKQDISVIILKNTWKVLLPLTLIIALITVIYIAYQSVFAVVPDIYELFGISSIGNFEPTDSESDFSHDNTPTDLENTSNINILVAIVGKEKVQADAVFVVNLNKEKNTADILQLPRDMYVYSSSNANTNRLSEVYTIGSINALKATIAETLKIPLDRYIVIKQNGFAKLIDLIPSGKVDVYIPSDMIYSDPVQRLEINLRAGNNSLNGHTAEMFARYSSYLGGEASRIEAQQILLASIIKSLLDKPSSINVANFVSFVLFDTKTNFNLSEATSLLEAALTLKKENIGFYSAPGGPIYIRDETYFGVNKEQLQTILRIFNTSDGELDIAELPDIPDNSDVIDGRRRTIDELTARPALADALITDVTPR